MSLLPSKEPGTVVQQTQLGPSDPKDERNWWHKFVNFLRQNIGLKPLYLAERFAEARVRKEEVEAEKTLLEAKSIYEMTVATAKKIELESEGQYAKDMAVAESIKANTNNSVDPIDETIRLQDFGFSGSGATTSNINTADCCLIGNNCSDSRHNVFIKGITNLDAVYICDKISCTRFNHHQISFIIFKKR